MEILLFLGGFFVGALCTFIPMFIINKSRELMYSQQNDLYKSMQEQMKLYFENTANKVLKDGSADLSEQNSKKLEEFFKRFKDKIDDFERRSMENLKTEIDKFDIFDTNIKSFLDAGKMISENTTSLVSVMKADNRTSGRWGEIVLEKVLELSGLRKDVEYRVQKGTAEGRPDAIILLPDNRRVYVDSKTSFQAWDGYSNAQSDAERDEYKKQFIDSTKKHIIGLSKKDYSLEGNSPEYVLMFIPIESCYSMMFCDDSTLWKIAWENNIMPVSPSTLLAALKIINAFYIAERQNKNVLEMAKLCAGVHDKFAALLTDMLKMRETFNSILKKLNGRGNVITQIKKLEDLSCKYEKNIPEIEEDFEEADSEVIY